MQQEPITAIFGATGIYRNAVLRRLPVAVLALVLAATAAASSRGSGEGRLDLVAFPGYAEAGGDDPRVNWVQPFVQKTGCKVHVRTVRSSTELLDAVDTAATTGSPPSGTSPRC